MLSKLSEREAFALARIVATDDFQIIRDYLQHNLDERDTANRHLDGVPLARSQGAAQLLADFLQSARDAAQIANRIRASRSAGAR